jgi:hypothetical protein
MKHFSGRASGASDRGYLSAIILVAFAFLLLNGIPKGWGEETAPGHFGPIAFDIPSQPLDEALQAYSRKSGVEVLYESSIARAVRSSAVKGAYTRQTALERLLEGTDLEVQYTRSDAVTIAAPYTQADVPPLTPLGDADLMLDTLRVSTGNRPSQRDLQDFSQSVQADIEKALRQNERTKSGNYRASVKLWIDPKRIVNRAELAQSTGDSERDASIASTLSGLVLRRQPPDNAPQPLRVVIVVRSM